MKLWPRTAASEARRDECREGLWYGQLREIADRLVCAVGEHELALRNEHPDRLDRIQRDSVRPGDDRLDRPFRQAGHQTREELPHGGFRQGFEMDARETPLGVPLRPSLEELGAGQRHDVDRPTPAPLEQVVDEVEQSRIGVMEVLEDHRHSAVLGDPLEERAPGAEQLLGHDVRLEPEQREQRRLDPASFDLIRNPFADGRSHLRPGGCFVVRFRQAAAAADHLAKRPERDPIAVGR